MSLPKDRAWFPTKRYGWGWGLPSRWQGWVVMIAFLLALAGGGLLVSIHPILYVVYAVILASGLCLVCYWKGETPRWRWGDDADDAGRKAPSQSPRS